MRVSHLVTAILVSVIVLLAGNLVAAPYSAAGFAVLEAQKTRLEANIAELEALQRTLGARVDLLTRSSDTVRLEARELGYYSDTDTVIRIVDAPPKVSLQSPGRVILGVPDAAPHRTPIRLGAALAGILCLSVLLLVDRHDSGHSMRRPSR